MKQYHIVWKGVQPLILHSCQTVNPLHPVTKAMKAITSKGTKKMTEEDHARVSDLEMIGGVYSTETDYSGLVNATFGLAMLGQFQSRPTKPSISSLATSSQAMPHRATSSRAKYFKPCRSSPCQVLSGPAKQPSAKSSGGGRIKGGFHHACKIFRANFSCHPESS